jgi:hypothetical protein
MSVAGVRLAGGRIAWVEAGVIDLRPLDTVMVNLEGRKQQATIIVTPNQLLRPVAASGQVVRVETGSSSEECGILPGADMPPLGSEMAGGVVVSVDAVKRTVTVEMPAGNRRTTGLEGSE